MKKNLLVVIAACIVAALGLTGIVVYRAVGKKAVVSSEGRMGTAEKKPSYWTCGMHPQIRRDKPGNCPICNMPLIPAYEEGSPQDAPQQKDAHAGHKMATKPAEAGEEIYVGCGVDEEGHCPHCDLGKADALCVCGGHAFTMEGRALKECPICKKPLKELTKEQAQKMEAMKEGKVVSRMKLTPQQKELGDIRTEALKMRHLSKTIRTVGEVAYDPELFVAEEEYLTAVETVRKVAASPDKDVIRRAEDLLESSRSKLLLFGLNEVLIKELEEAGKSDQSLTLPQGRMWVYASIYEHEISWIKTGMPATVKATAFPGEEFKGVLRSINPVLDEKTRSVQVRIQVDNPDMKLKPRMYAEVIIESMFVTKGSHETLAVPEEAVLDTGTRKVVYVEAGPGEYLGKEVRLGPLAESTDAGRMRRFYPVLEGLNEGEVIVTRGNFLIDSQTQLSGSMSVLWGGAQEFKEKPQEAAPVATQHKH
ncbi:MAG TPA: hypothetical protein DCL35_04770 [Candidatus Omnitrophica bacterium]|nr:hypothetical protein [Candidatus Omnitrophota bacterium]